mgnify:FL=1
MKGYVGVPSRGAHTSKVKYNRVMHKLLLRRDDEASEASKEILKKEYYI